MNWEAEDPEEPPGKRSRKAPSAARYALKVLCPDELTGQILGRGSKVKDHIQKESKAHLTFSRKEDYFPNTSLRVLAIYADEIWSLLRALEGIMEKLVECADQEHVHPALPGCELMSKEPGEYILRLCLPVKASSVVIGTGGQNVKQLRQDHNVKVVVEKDSFIGHQLVRVVGNPASINAALEKVNEYVHKDAGSEAYLQYSQLVNFSDAMDPQREAADESEWLKPAWQPKLGPPSDAHEAHTSVISNNRGVAHKPVVVSPLGAPRAPGAHPQQGASHLPVVVPPPIRQDYEAPQISLEPEVAFAEVAGDDTAEDSYDPGVDQLMEAVHSMPTGTADMAYSINFTLPDALQRSPWHEDDEFRQYLEETTGAKIEAAAVAGPPGGKGAPPRQLSVVGPLMAVYAAHILVLQKATEVEREEREEAERSQQAAPAGSVEEMQNQVLELQKQLKQANEAKAAAEALAAAALQGRQGGGKAKGKGKSKSKKK